MMYNQLCCEKCGDVIGPWCMYKDHETKKAIFICEDCWEEIKKKVNEKNDKMRKLR